MAGKKPKVSLLFLSSEPTDASRLRVAQEQRDVSEVLRLASARNVAMNSRFAVRARDLSDALHEHRPTIVHFSGHGTASGEICVEDVNGVVAAASATALGTLFAEFADTIQCVVLNSCYSARQADEIAKSVAFVVGFAKPVDDGAAIAFATGFYKAVAAGRKYADSFRLGLAEMRLEGFDPEKYDPRISSRRPQDWAHFIEPSDNRSHPAHITVKHDRLSLVIDPLQVKTIRELTDLAYLKLLYQEVPPLSYGSEWMLKYGGGWGHGALVTTYKWAFAAAASHAGQVMSGTELNWPEDTTLEDLDILPGEDLSVLRAPFTRSTKLAVLDCDDARRRKLLRTQPKYYAFNESHESVVDPAAVPVSHVVILDDWLGRAAPGQMVRFEKNSEDPYWDRVMR